jgi:hypothetical protein
MRFGLLVVAMLIAPASLLAQRLAPEFASLRDMPAIESMSPSSPAPEGLLGDGSRDHRYAGMYAGLGVGMLMVAMSLAMCSDPDSGCDSGKVVPRIPVVLVFMGGVGALIGRAFPKTPKASR